VNDLPRGQPRPSSWQLGFAPPCASGATFETLQVATARFSRLTASVHAADLDV
jgi:hypothetical protein